MKGFMKRASISVFCAIAVFLMASVAGADSFPQKPVTMLIPYKAGGSTDTMGRLLAKALRKEFKQPVVVVNRTGGSGTVAATFLKNSAPDGYTFMMGGAEIPVWNPLTQQVEYGLDDFTYLAAIAQYQNALITLKDNPYKNLEELIDYSKKNPGSIKCAYQTQLDKVIIERIMEKAGVEWSLVSTTGGGEVMQLIFGKKIDISYSGGFHNQYPEKLEVLASFNETRLAGAKDKATVKELGYGISFPSEVVFMTNGDVPEDVAAILEKAILAASQDKDFKTLVEERMKSPVIQVGSEELTKTMQGMAETFAELVHKN